MKLRAELIAPLVKAQIEHIKIADPDFLDKKKNHLRKAVTLTSSILAENEHCWGVTNDYRLLKGRITFPTELISPITIHLLTASIKQFQFDADLVVSEIEKVQDSSLGFIESLEALIQSSLNEYSDYQNLFRVLTLAEITEQTFYGEIIAHFALTKFRIQKGFMGVRPGNYIPVADSAGWDDQQCAKEYSYGVGLSPTALEQVLEGLEKSYSKMTAFRADCLTSIYRANLNC